MAGTSLAEGSGPDLAALWDEPEAEPEADAEADDVDRASPEAGPGPTV